MPGIGEEPLQGGFTNAGRVARVGDTVRRPWRPTSPSTRALLEHLERVGFDGAPRFLGVDDHGREVLSYVPGEAAVDPVPSWALTDTALVSVAALLRRYHDAVASFAVEPHAWARAVPPAFRHGIVCHNDPNLDNVVFAGGAAVALIDFDLAGPAYPAWDVACAVRLWAPLRADEDIPAALRGRTLHRLGLFVDAYGMEPPERELVVDAMVHTHDWCYSVVRKAVLAGHESFGEMWHGGGAQRALRTRHWLATHHGAMRTALGL